MLIAAAWLSASDVAVAAPPPEGAMPPRESDAPRSSAPPVEDAMPPRESPAYRSAAQPTERAMPPRESSGYRSAALTRESPMPPAAAAAGRERGRRRRARRPLPAWLTQLAPVDQSVELAALVGAWLPAYAHELYDGRAGWKPLARGFAELGARVAYFPVRWMGFEFDGVGMPGSARDGRRVTLGSFRGGLVLRLPWRVAPLLSGGVGALGASSASDVVGDDVDAAFHIGAGVQVFVTRVLHVRIDGRDVLSHRRGVGGGPAHHGELLASIGLRFGPRAAAAPTPGVTTLLDGDLDRVPDALDRCPREAGVPPYGCPPRDRDGDGVDDTRDRCADIPGTPADGCPAPVDDDGDGVADPLDRCPLQIGVAPDGCPAAAETTPPEPPEGDADGDGLARRDDRCPAQRESRNGYDDADGCPDEMPAEVAELEGVLTGIGFKGQTAELTPESRATLTRVADVLQRNPGVRCEIVGHTDDRGSSTANRRLSSARAERVVTALVERGVPAERLQSRGAGPDEPLASNASAQGRATNRRVELAILRE